MEKYIIAPPAGSQTNAIGAKDRPWEEVHAKRYPGLNEYLAESTGYGIVSGCEPSISGLTVTVGAGIVHLADGKRKEIVQTNITLDAADPTNPRIDLVYIDSTGTVAKITGTAAASPSAPTLPSGGISICTTLVSSSTQKIISVGYYSFTKNSLKEIYKSLHKINDFVGIVNPLEKYGSTFTNILSSSRFDIIRSDVQWGQCEKSLGVYDFATQIARAKMWISNGKIFEMTLNYGNALYGDSMHGFSTSAQRTGFCNFAVAFVNALKAEGITGQRFDILNEPNLWWTQTNKATDYALLLQQLYPQMKAADPSCTIITHNLGWSSNTTDGLRFFNDTLKNEAYAYTDAIGIHSYVRNNPERASDIFENFRNVLMKYTNDNIPFLCTETGYSACVAYEGGTAPIALEDLRRKYIKRIILNNISNGIFETLIYDSFQNENLEDANPEKWYGIYSSVGATTLTSESYESFASDFGDYGYVGVYDSGDDYKILQFITKSGDLVYMGWCYSGTKSLIIKGNLVTLTDDVQVVTIDNSQLVGETKHDDTLAVKYNNASHNLYIDYPKTARYDKIYDANVNDVDGYHNIFLGYGLKNTPSNNYYNYVSGYQNTINTGSNSNVLGKNNIINGNDDTIIGKYCVAGNGKTYIINTISDTTITATTPIGSDISVGTEVIFSGAIPPEIRTVQSVSGSTITVNSPVNNNHLVFSVAGTTMGGNTCFGNQNAVSGVGNLVAGTTNSANTNDSFVIGHRNNATYQDSIICGSYNAPQTSYDRFIVGRSITTRANAFRITYEGNAYAMGAYNTVGADYAEYFEWADENVNNDDRVGYFVTFDNKNMIRLANDADTYILGVVSGNPAIMGNSYAGNWRGLFLEDDFGRVIKDDSGNPIINPDYDNTKEYIGRDNRKEWAAVGMLGVLPVRDDGTCEVNGYCKVADGGIATKANSGYRVVARVADNIIKVLFR